MTTAEFVTLLLEEVGAGWTRPRALEVANDVQNEELGCAIDLMRVKPDPFVATTDAVYTYAASSFLYNATTGAQGSLIGDIRDVKEVYRLPSAQSLDDLTPLDPTSDKPQYIEYHNPRRVIARVDVIPSIEPDSTDCTLKWWEQYNPGTTTITWRAVAYTWPSQLTSENVALKMPADFQRTLLLWGCLRHMERREYGKVDPVMHIRERMRFRTKYQARSGQNIMGVAQPRFC